MECKKGCLFCKHSVVGDSCNKKIGFKYSSKKELHDRLIVYKCRKDYLEFLVANARDKTIKKDIEKKIKKTNKDILSLEEKIKELYPKYEIFHNSIKKEV